jgi:hypothetical protein
VVNVFVRRFVRSPRHLRRKQDKVGEGATFPHAATGREEWIHKAERAEVAIDMPISPGRFGALAYG